MNFLPALFSMVLRNPLRGSPSPSTDESLQCTVRYALLQHILSNDFGHSCRKGNRVLSHHLDVGVVKVSITCNKACLVRGQDAPLSLLKKSRIQLELSTGEKKRGTMPLQCGFAKLPRNWCFLSPGGEYLSNVIQYIHHKRSIKS